VGYGRDTLRVTVSPGDSVVVRIVLCEHMLGLEEVVVAGTASEDGYIELSASLDTRDEESITNVQHEGVDEGGIVKRHGDHLIILRRGRLFTIRLGGDDLRPVSMIDAYAPDIDPRYAWYDEMLIIDGWIVVVGYSYRRAGTELGIFSVDDDGLLRYHSTYHLRSSDYYSSRNYASRVVGGRLVFYAPLPIHLGRSSFTGIDDLLPGMRRWRGSDEGGFQPIASVTNIYRPARALDLDQVVALHTVTSCSIDDGELDCDATAVFGPFGHTFYVSPRAVYVWMSSWWARADEQPSTVVRMPLDGAAPSALGVRGSPIDQFSFLESDAEHLNVLVSSAGRGQWMWAGEYNPRGLALLRVPIAHFGDGANEADSTHYQPLDSSPSGSLINRFVGDHLLYGFRHWWRRSEASDTIRVVNWRSGQTSYARLGHQVERIESLGRHAVVVGQNHRDLTFTSLRLGDGVRVASRYGVGGAAQSESRSHGFFYRPTDDDAGVLGLPVRTEGSNHRGRWSPGQASITYLTNQSLTLTPIGALEASAVRQQNDDCKASCVDWYGNARPIFLGDRVFALMGYELVEGRIGDGAIKEVRRVDFSPTERSTRE
jgi:hypothetical protein